MQEQCSYIHRTGMTVISEVLNKQTQKRPAASVWGWKCIDLSIQMYYIHYIKSTGTPLLLKMCIYSSNSNQNKHYCYIVQYSSKKRASVPKNIFHSTSFMRSSHVFMWKELVFTLNHSDMPRRFFWCTHKPFMLNGFIKHELKYLMEHQETSCDITWAKD